MIEQTYFFTGYPGFLASNLIKQLLHDDDDDKINRVYLLTLPQLKAEAEKNVLNLCLTEGVSLDLFTIITGDITKPSLDINQQMNTILREKVTHVFHLAAVYDLAVPRDIAYHVNTVGTKLVNEWVRTLNNLERYIYFSTAYVSGNREGRIYESELVKGQSFKNYYEETKYHAEVLVKHLQEEGFPVTIIRPGVVKGSSLTGRTIKFDGLYFLLNVLHHVRFLPAIPYIGHGEPEGNFVPVDYILKAASYLAIHPVGKNKTYHLTDPAPYKMWELQKMLSEYYLGRTPKGSVPLSVVKASLQVPFIRQWLEVEAEALDYFLYQASYDTSQATKDLKDAGIQCPDLRDTLPSMIQFYRKYRDDHQKQLFIK